MNAAFAWIKANAALSKLVGALVLVVILVISVKCYGDRRAKDALETHAATVADSVSKIMEVRFRAARDSAIDDMRRTQRHNDSVTTAAVAVLAQQAAVNANALRAQQQYRSLPPATIAALPIEVQQTLAALQSSNAQLLASNAQLSTTVTTLIETNRNLVRSDTILLGAIAAADSTIAAQRRTIVAYQVVKTPRRGVLYYAGEVGKAAVSIVAGAALAKAL